MKLSRQSSCQEATACQTYSRYPRVGFCLSTGRCTGTLSTRHCRFPGAKGARLHLSNTVAAEFTGSEHSRLQHLEKVYRSRIANVHELENASDQCFDQSIVEASIGQWRRHLSASVHGAGHTLSTKHKVSATLSSIYQKLKIDTNTTSGVPRGVRRR